MAYKEQQSFLLFADMAGALARSKQMANAMHCDGVYCTYWYGCVQLTDGRGAMQIDPDGWGTGAYDSKPGPTALSQLTPAEIAALVPWSTVQPYWPPAGGAS